MSDWRFSDPQNVAVFVTSRIIQGAAAITYFGHDSDDGAWQFHDSNSQGDPKVVSLKQVVDLDPSVEELYDLPLGWCARRNHRSSPWTRSKKD
ncbi:MAG: hypothetical protein ACT4OF_12400 [Caulobacteraceae bacterium]